MALALENANNVRQKVFSALGNLTGTTAGSGNPYAFYAMKAFFLNHAANSGNADLQFVDIDQLSVDDSQGQDHGIDAACQVYAVWLKKQNSATDVAYALIDNAATDSAEGTQTVFSIVLDEASAQALIVSPTGLPVTLGLVSKAWTTVFGVTDATSAETPSGFIIVGAA